MKQTIKIFIAAVILAVCLGTESWAQDKIKVGNIVVDNDTLTVSNDFLDSLNVRKKIVINDYTLIGVQYGVNLNQMNWNPKSKQHSQFTPLNFGITWTRYCKMFGYMPYFGIQAGLYYTREGYKMKEYYEVEGASEALIDVLELPLLAHFHFDFWKMKIMANIGLYGAYRLSIQRFGENVTPGLENSFASTDRRWDYGIKGGLGFGFVFDPVEIHFNAMYKYGMGNLYKPNHNSDYFYKFAYASNFTFSVSLHFQLTKRIGRTRHELRQEAKKAYQESLTKSATK